MTSELPSAAPGSQAYFDAAIAGMRVAADGGNEAVEAQHGGKFAVASREMFEGRLTGRRLDEGDPPWRWLEIGDLSDKPEGFEDATVWCEETYVYFLDR